MRYTMDIHFMHYGYTCDADTVTRTAAVRAQGGKRDRAPGHRDGSFIKNKIAVKPDSF